VYAVVRDEVEDVTGKKMTACGVFIIKSINHLSNTVIVKQAGQLPSWPPTPRDDIFLRPRMPEEEIRFQGLEKIRRLRDWNLPLLGVAKIGGESDATGTATGGTKTNTRMMLFGNVSLLTILLYMRRKGLPDDIGDHIGSFLEVKSVNFPQVSVIRASSDRNDFPLDSVLQANPRTWWISGEGSMIGGRGEEFIEFQLDPRRLTKRVSFIGISIPPLPYGPLSVRKFRIDSSMTGEGGGAEVWTRGCVFETADMSGVQTYELPQPIDAVFVRFVAITNASASTNVFAARNAHDCVGLYHVRFK